MVDSIQQQAMRRAGLYMLSKKERRFQIWADIGTFLFTIGLVAFMSYVLVLVLT
jgi:hypothetical protein